MIIWLESELFYLVSSFSSAAISIQLQPIPTCGDQSPAGTSTYSLSDAHSCKTTLFRATRGGLQHLRHSPFSRARSRCGEFAPR